MTVDDLVNWNSVPVSGQEKLYGRPLFWQEKLAQQEEGFFLIADGNAENLHLLKPSMLLILGKEASISTAITCFQS